MKNTLWILATVCTMIGVTGCEQAPQSENVKELQSKCETGKCSTGKCG